MSSQLFRSLGQQPQLLPPPFGNVQNMIAQFNQFKQTFTGNPQQKVQELLNSGKMSQAQFENLRKLATQVQQVMK